MPPVINITDEDIAYAEGIILPPASHFDAERIDFIKDMRTLDLQAVPGSGKTTALLAKLLILDRLMPFKDGSGVLVISHTNAAVDEIKERIGKYCNHLFKYPNFVGTIQGFADTFLTMPYYVRKFKTKPIRIDNEIYIEKASAFSRLGFTGFTNQEANNAKSFLRSNDQFKTIRLTRKSEGLKLTKTYYGEELNISKPKGNTKPANYVDWNDAEKTKVRQWLFEFKKHLIRKGYLCYDDAYTLAFEYLYGVPKIKIILQHRFPFVFVDEMQDMDHHQYDLLENIFQEGSIPYSIVQRIGDKNQAIFNGDAKLQDIWTDRPLVLRLSGSYRLSSSIANAVEPFGLFALPIIGRHKNDDGTEILIKPHLFVYEKNRITEVLAKFASTIASFESAGLLPEQKSYRAIAWNTKPEPNKTRLGDYYPAFSREIHKPKVDHETMEGYMNGFDVDCQTLVSAYKCVINCFLRILRLEDIDNSGRSFTKQTLFTFIEKKNSLAAQNFKLKTYQWSVLIVKNKKSEAVESMREYVPEFLLLFSSRGIISCSEFLNNTITGISSSITEVLNPNKFNSNGVTIDVGTVHSVKGQTHTATLYLETFYSKGKGNFESERLHEQLNGQPFNSSSINIVKQSTKMVYVGFSRPTHLLAFAVQKERYDSHLSGLDSSKWEIIHV